MGKEYNEAINWCDPKSTMVTTKFHTNKPSYITTDQYKFGGYFTILDNIQIR